MKEVIIKDILKEPSTYTASKWIIEGIPFIFNDDLDSYIQWKNKLSELIGVDSKSIVFTGTSSVGYSLNPYKNFKEFSADSDIDVAIISSHYFDITWHFLRNLGAKYHRFKPDVQNVINEHRDKYIYFGTIATDKIIHILPFAQQWIEAMDEMKKYSPTKKREINFRIYKDFEALKSYQVIGINKIKDKLLKPQ